MRKQTQKKMTMSWTMMQYMSALSKAQLKTVLLVFTMIGFNLAWAETDNSVPVMDHSKMKMEGNMQGMDNSQMDMSTMDMSDPKQAGQMDMGDMQIQGGTAPPDARDPNAYSDGQTLTSGDYVLPGPRQLSMADEHSMLSIMVEQLEFVAKQEQNSTAYDFMVSYGRDYNKLVIKAEGDVVDSKLEEARTEALWSHAVATYWDTQLGMRYDSGADMTDRSWLAAGVQGIAPYWFEIEATAYIGNDSRTAFRLQAEYELLITQKLVLQPRLETSLYGKSDPARELGSGLADVTAGIRLRYEIKREFAPYIGIEYSSKYGETADMASAAGVDVSDTHLVAGLRFWY